MIGAVPPTPAPSSPQGQRLWRLRKLNQQVDAHLCDQGAAGVDLQFIRNGEVMYTRRWGSRDGALAEAAEKRLELERGGWTAHW